MKGSSGIIGVSHPEFCAWA